MKKENKLSWGVTLLFFGILFLLKIWGHAPAEIANYAFDVRNFPIVVGIIFLIFHSDRSIGVAMIVLGIFMRFEYLVRLTKPISVYIFPALLIVVGAIMVFGVKKGK